MGRSTQGATTAADENTVIHDRPATPTDVTATVDRFDEAAAAINRRAAERAAALEAARWRWLSHHDAEHLDRCTVIAGRPVCRRCLVLYPVSLVAAASLLAGLRLWPEHLDVWIVWCLSLPGTVEFVAEQTGFVPYSPRRQMAATVITAIAFGTGVAHELDARWSPLFWGPVAVFGALWFAATTLGARRRVVHG
jgi:hypothetical protein